MKKSTALFFLTFYSSTTMIASASTLVLDVVENRIELTGRHIAMTALFITVRIAVSIQCTINIVDKMNSDFRPSVAGLLSSLLDVGITACMLFGIWCLSAPAMHGMLPPAFEMGFILFALFGGAIASPIIVCWARAKA